MPRLIAFVALAPLLLTAALAQDHGTARPDLIVKEVVAGMPRGDRQEIKVLTATLKPGDKTPFHTHRFPVTAYILEGAFTLEMEGRPPVTLDGRPIHGRAAERQDDRLQSRRRAGEDRDLLRQRSRRAVPRRGALGLPTDRPEAR